MSQLTANTTTIDELITMANNLPDAGSSGEDVSAETAEYTSLLTDLETAIDALPDAGSGGGASVETCTVTVKPIGSPITNSCYTTVDENGELLTIFAGTISPAGQEFICACGSMIVFSMTAYISMTTENAEKVAEFGSSLKGLAVKITASAGGTASIQPIADMGN